MGIIASTFFNIALNKMMIGVYSLDVYRQTMEREVRSMLVLTRCVGERLIINDGEIQLNVLEVKGNQVRIGINAPKHVTVHREEVYDRIHSKEKA